MPPGEPKGTPWHPHRGFETVTYIIDGVFDHHDSHGGGGTHHQRRHPVDDRRLRPAAHRDPTRVAGAERRALPRHPALGQPAARRQDERPALPGPPLRRGQPSSRLPTRGALVRVIAGEVDGHAGPGATYTPMTLVHATLEPGARLELPVGRRLQRAGLRAQRRRHRRHRRPADRTAVRPRVLGAGDFLTVSAADKPGEPVARSST